MINFFRKQVLTQRWLSPGWIARRRTCCWIFAAWSRKRMPRSCLERINKRQKILEPFRRSGLRLVPGWLTLEVNTAWWTRESSINNVMWQESEINLKKITSLPVSLFWWVVGIKILFNVPAEYWNYLTYVTRRTGTSVYGSEGFILPFLIVSPTNITGICEALMHTKP